MRLRNICLAIGVFLITVFMVVALSGNDCDSTSPCSCGVACQGQLDPQSNGDNTIDGCLDGSNSKYEWTEDLTVTDLNSSTFRIGHTVSIDANFRCDEGEGDEVAINYHNGTSWRLVLNGSCNIQANVHFYQNITLDNVIGTHGFRAIIAWKGNSSGMTCGYDYDQTYSDTDDITIQVLGPSDSTSPNITSLAWPEDNNKLRTEQVDFNFSVFDDTSISNCSLWINSTGSFHLNRTSTTITNNASATNNISTSLGDGSYLWNIQCFDSAGNSDWYETNLSFSIDSTKPTIAFIAPITSDNSYTNTNNLIINVSFSDVHNDSLILEWNGTNQSNAFNYLGDDAWQAEKAELYGTYQFRVIGNDSYGNINATSWITATFDNESPSVFDLLSPGNNSNATNAAQLAPMLNWSSTSDANFANYTVKVSDNENFSHVNKTYSITTSAATSHYKVISNWKNNITYYWKVIAYDLAGNSRNSSSVFIYNTDSGMPSIILNFPEDGVHYNHEYFNFSYYSSDNNLDTCSLWINSSGNFSAVAFNSSPDTEALNYFRNISVPEGNLLWNVLCNDSGGQEAFAATNFTNIIDRTLPKVSFNALTPEDEEIITSLAFNISIDIIEPKPVTIIFEWNGTNTTYNYYRISMFNITKAVSSDGYYVFRAFVNDSSGNMNSTVSRQVYVDTTVPSINNANVSPTMGRHYSIFNISANITDFNNISSAYAQINLPNSSALNCTIAVNADGFGSCGYNASLAGDYSTIICATDGAGLSGCNNVVLNFTADVSSMNITSISYTPSDADSLDPGVTIVINASVKTGITRQGLNTSVVLLQYKEANESSWSSKSMEDSGGYFYIGNFTPGGENNWTFRIWANNTLGNSNQSIQYNLSVFNDKSWTILPSSLDLGTTGSVLGASNVVLGNITINNTGDSAIIFNISQHSGSVALLFNWSDPMLVSAGSESTIMVRQNAPLVAGTYPARIKLYSLSSNTLPSQRIVNVSLITYTSGPYLIMPIVTYDSAVTQGDNIPVLKTKISNLGNDSCAGANLTWLLPSGWTTRDDLNDSLGNIVIGETIWQNISADVGSSATTGTVSLIAKVECDNGLSFNDSRSVTVSEAGSDEEPAPDPPSSGGSGGGSIVSSISYVTTDYNLTINATEKTYAKVGETAIIKIKVTNSKENTLIEDLKISINDYFITYTNITTKIAPKEEGMGFKDIAEYEAALFVPEYARDHTYDITIEAIGLGKNSNSTFARKTNVSESRSIKLIIVSANASELVPLAEEANKKGEELKSLGIEEKVILGMLERIDLYISKQEYNRAKEMIEELDKFYDKAIEFISFLKETEEGILGSKSKGIDVSSSEKLIAQAKDMFFLGKIDNAKDMLEKAVITERIVAKTQEARISARLKQFIIDNKVMLLSIILVLVVIGTALARYVQFRRIKEKIKASGKREKKIIEQMKLLQESYFVDKVIGERVYKQTIGLLREKIAIIENDKIRLASRRSFFRKKDRESLNDEISMLENLLKEINQKYYVKRIIPQENFNKLKKICVSRIASAKEELLLIEKKGSRKKEKEKKKEDNNNNNNNKKNKKEKEEVKIPIPKEDEEEDQEKAVLEDKETKKLFNIKDQKESEQSEDYNNINEIYNKKASNPFYLMNGAKAESIKEIEQAIKDMNEPEFLHHVNENKNDFASWIEDCLMEKDIADMIRSAESKEDLLDVLEQLRFEDDKKERQG